MSHHPGLGRVLFGFLLALGAAQACATENSSSGNSNTNFVTCTSAANCAEGKICVEGTCVTVRDAGGETGGAGGRRSGSGGAINATGGIRTNGSGGNGTGGTSPGSGGNNPGSGGTNPGSGGAETGGSGTGGAFDAGASFSPVSCDGTCPLGTYCMELQPLGGASLYHPNDAGACPPGFRVLPESTPDRCWADPTYRCFRIPTSCGNPPDCNCSQTLCNQTSAGSLCTEASATHFRCLEHLP